MTWRQLGTPEYVMVFVRYFLFAFLPTVGLATAAGNGGTLEIHGWPSLVSTLAGVGSGLINGIQAIQTYRATPPAPSPTAAPGP